LHILYTNPMILSMSINNQESEGPKDPGKRLTLKRIGKAAAAFGIAYIASKIPGALVNSGTNTAQASQADIPTANQNQSNQLIQSDISQTAPAIKEITKIDPPPQNEPKEEIDHGFNRLNEILALPLTSEIRLQKEAEYVEWAESLEQIDNGFLGVFDTNLRGKLLDKRFSLREKGHPNLPQLTGENRVWAENNRFHPESFAVCIDSYNEAKEILHRKFEKLRGEQFYEIFRPDLAALSKQEDSGFSKVDLVDLQTRENSVDELLMNPGGMLYLINRETGMGLSPRGLRYLFVHIGNEPAKNALLRTYPESREPGKAKGLITALENICQKLSAGGPLKYRADNVPGSSLSGDIGSYQALTETFQRENKFSETFFNRSFNPFGLEAVVLAYLFLAHGWAWKTPAGKQQYQIGYLKDSIDGKDRSTFRKDALIKWNETLAKETLEWAEKYYKEVILK